MTHDEALDMMAMDTPRLWANQCQVLQNGPTAMIIFREMASVNFELDGTSSERHEVKRNVASVILPVEVAQQLGQILIANFAEPSAEARDGDPA